MVEAVRPENRRGNAGTCVGISPVDEEVIDMEDSESGTRKVTRIADPSQPSKEEVEEHEKSHVPYRSWCRHCVRGGAKDMPHRKCEEKVTIPEVHADFIFMGEEEHPRETVAILIMRDRTTKMSLATALPSKSTGTFAAERAWCFLREIGLGKGDMVLKADQESAIQAILKDVEKLRGENKAGRTIMEASPVGSHQSNGIIERYAQEIEKQVRIMKSALEERWGLRLDAKRPVIPWLIEHAAFLLNRLQVGKDGKTAYERCKGKPAKTAGIEFGELVLWRRQRRGDALGKMTCLWEDGVFLGIKGSTGEVKIADKNGIWKARAVQRRPISERWKAEAADWVIWGSLDQEPYRSTCRRGAAHLKDYFDGCDSDDGYDGNYATRTGKDGSEGSSAQEDEHHEGGFGDPWVLFEMQRMQGGTERSVLGCALRRMP